MTAASDTAQRCLSDPCSAESLKWLHQHKEIVSILQDVVQARASWLSNTDRYVVQLKEIRHLGSLIASPQRIYLEI